MKVSVIMVAYNHERFIEQALNSILAQKVNFDYEIVVGEDCSTDRTREVLLNFHRRYPNQIVPLLRDHNVGAMPNFIATLAACRGQYLAFLEGDDYWIHTDKLQRQIDFLDSHPEYAICCTRAQIQNETSTTETGVLPHCPPGQYGLEDLLKLNFIVTCTVVYRLFRPVSVPKWLFEMAMGDWPLHVLEARNGKIHLMDEVTATYRIHSGGIWSSLRTEHRLHEIIRMLKALDKHLGHRYDKIIAMTILKCYFDLAGVALAKGDRLNTGKYVMGCLLNGGWRLTGSRRTLGAYAAYCLMGSRYRVFSKSNRK